MSARVWLALAVLAIFSGIANTQQTSSPAVCHVPMDIVVILDASGSITIASWRLMVGFTNNMISDVNIEPTKIRMALIMFASSVTTISGLDQDTSRTKLLTKFAKVKKSGGGTNTHLAIQTAINIHASTGRNKTKIVILVTDGQSNDNSATVNAAKRLHNLANTHVFAIGIGNYKLTEINAIATKPNPFYTSKLVDFNILNVIAKLLVIRSCDIGIGIVTDDDCTTNEDCKHIKNSVCKLNICVCASKRLQFDNATMSCIPKDGGSAICNNDTDCSLRHGAKCDPTTATCMCPFGNCQECKLGSPCDRTLSCTSAITGWQCVNGNQTCSPSHVPSGFYVCKVIAFGGNCSSDLNCKEINGTCNSIKKQCECSHEALKYNEDTVKCIPRLIGDNCATDGQCSFINNATCVFNKCKCSSPFISTSGNICGRCSSAHQIYNPTTQRCSFRGIGDSCSVDSDCKNIPNAACVNGKCACASMYGRIASANSCGYCALGSYCEAGINCTMHIAYSVCLGNLLSCEPKAGQVNMICVLRVINTTCAVDADCSDSYKGSAPYRCVNSKCACADGYKKDDKGLTCKEITIGSGCSNDADCRTVPGSYCKNATCMCKVGYMKYPSAKGCAGPCELQKPCLNGGICSDTSTGDYSCQCQGAYRGVNCEIAPDPCIGVTCYNNGNCSRATGRCVCTIDYTGPTCSVPTDPCIGVTCFNGGMCLRHAYNPRAFQCLCIGGWTGWYCTTAPFPCVNNAPCLNGGTCVKRGGVFSCQCSSYFDGIYCEIAVAKPCEPQPCVNGGTCIPRYKGGYVCKCPYRYTGPTCGIAPNPCDSAPCQNGGRCERLYYPLNSTPYKCRCAASYAGSNCQLDACTNNFCRNGGSCWTSGKGILRCDCRKGYTGQYCQIRADQCRSNPCQNGGTCITRSEGNAPSDAQDSSPGYTCQCSFGYQGDKCENGTLFLTLVIVFACLGVILLGAFLCRCLRGPCNGNDGDEKEIIVSLPGCNQVAPATPCTTPCYPTNLSTAHFNSRWSGSQSMLSCHN